MHSLIPKFPYAGIVAALFRILMVVAPAAAHGHDMFEITAKAELAADRIEMLVSMARGTAMVACGQDGENVPSFETTEFEGIRELFEARATALFEITANLQPLEALAVTARLTSENDLEFRFRYPRPASGPLRIDALCMKQLPAQGYGVALAVYEDSDGARRVRGDTLLDAENPVWETDWPPAPIAVLETVTSAPPAVKPSLLAPGLATVTLFIAAAAWFSLQKRRAA